MAQQINLARPIFLKEKHYFSANSMAIAVFVFMVFGVVLLGFCLKSIRQTQETFRELAQRNQLEIDAQQAAIQAGKANSAPADTALMQQLQITEKNIQIREQQLTELQRGLFRPGWGHSARLQLVAQSVPPQVWVTELKADELRFSLSGFTLEPAALNEWVARLSASPLLSGQSLATVKVEQVATKSNPASGTGPAAQSVTTPSVSPQSLSLQGLTLQSLGQLSQTVQNLATQNMPSPNPEPRNSATDSRAKAAPEVPVWSFTLVSAVPTPGGKESGARP